MTEGIEEIRANSVLSADGVEHEADTIIRGTGFGVLPRVFDREHGTDGRSICDRYRERLSSYFGATLAGFPNFFGALGPFGVAGNPPAISMIEAQVRYIVDAVTTMRAQNIRRIDVREKVQRAFLDEVSERSRDTAWLTGGCRSYYLTADGGYAGLYPNWSFEYRRRTSRFDPESYEVRVR
ncbi:hypothetical protein AB4305_16315 [Nocardia sp. 2YAB30]|uniref:hypothetical protein n=1 Tax=unclassified Nocardia TaxID=2637762 RepID=UPI003F96C5D0